MSIYKLPKSVQDYKIIRQIKLVSNEKRVSQGTQTNHWTSTVGLVDQEIQCDIQIPSCDVSTETETTVESDCINHSIGINFSEATNAVTDTETTATVNSEAIETTATVDSQVTETNEDNTFSMSDGWVVFLHLK